MPMKQPAALMGLAREDVLLCGVRDCIAALSLRVHPAPTEEGWVIRDGWWLCPDHVDVVPGEC